MILRVRFSAGRLLPVFGPSVIRALLEQSSRGRMLADAINEYTRSRLREDGWVRQMLPPVPVEDIDFDDAVLANDSPPRELPDRP